jgi:putative phage-type endonuclease
MILLDIEQDTPAWHDLRRTKIGASDAPIILGKSPYKKPSQLMEEKLLGKKGYSSPQMRRGKELEPKVREWYCHNRMEVVPAVAQSESYDWMIASLDGISKDHKAIIEIKCPNEETYDAFRRGNFPKHYEWQMQHQMAVTGLDVCTLVMSDGKNQLDLDVPRDRSMIDQLLEAEHDFYQKMLNFEYPNDECTKVQEREDKEALEIVDAIVKAKQWLDTAKEQYDIIRDGAIYLANEISFRCKGIVVRKMLVQGSVDYKRMIKDYNIDPEKYRTPGRVQWRIEGPQEI